jgi:hypothetical protein
VKTVTSKDGTTIAFDQSGTGPALILVHGAFLHRVTDQQMAQLATFVTLTSRVRYDRRGGATVETSSLYSPT